MEHRGQAKKSTVTRSEPGAALCSASWIKRLTACVLLLGLSLSLAPGMSLAEKKKAPTTEYVTIKPAITTNYLSEKLSYVQADVAIKVRGKVLAAAVEEHMPRIKHSLILILSRQASEGVSSQEGRTVIREIALEEINAIMEGEGLEPNVEDVLFTRFIVE